MNTTYTKIEDDEGFSDLSELAYNTAGLVLSPKKATMIKSRLRHRLKFLQLDNLKSYCKFVSNDHSQNEIAHMISALTTNVSDFFREPHHFEFLTKNTLPKLLARGKEGERIRIWSAGCSNGQEPYSIAILLNEFSSDFLKMDLRILATDIDHNVLSHAKDGCYEVGQVSGLEEERLNHNFTNDQERFRVTDDIRRIITFRKLNLLNDWPMKGQFDVIFCRNVVIYFDSPTQEKLWPKFRRQLKPDGVMFVGHSERITDSGFSPCGATAYQLTTNSEAF